MNNSNSIKSYKCDCCGHTEYLFYSPKIPKEKNIIAKNCPRCFFGSLIVDFDDYLNFNNDDFLERYF